MQVKQAALDPLKRFLFGRHQAVPSKVNAALARTRRAACASSVAARSSSLRPFLGEFVIDQRLGGPALLGGDFEQAIGERAGLRRLRPHLRNQCGGRLAAAVRSVQDARGVLHAFPNGQGLVCRGRPAGRQLFARGERRLALHVLEHAGGEQRPVGGVLGVGKRDQLA